MIIANPIYDVVFKYLMANLDIAKGIISTIINEEIVTLDFKTQTNVIKFKKKINNLLTYHHLDFIAKIKLKEGGYKNVLIELQKSNIPYDINRFRKYLGSEYQKVDEVALNKEKSVKEAYPIVTIYFLGFKLPESLPNVIRVNRQYIDLLNGKEIHERSEFIEKLTHDSYVIQIPGLHLELKTRLERVLSVFQQENFTDNTHRIKNYKHKIKDELLEMMLNQLEKAAADPKLQRKLELEEMALCEYESTFSELERKLETKDTIILEKDRVIEEKNKALEENQKTLDQMKSYIRKLEEDLELKKP